MCAHVLCHFRHVQLFATLWTVAHQDLLSMGFSKQQYWSGLPCPPPGNLPDPGIEPIFLMSPALAGGFFTLVPPGKPRWECVHRSNANIAPFYTRDLIIFRFWDEYSYFKTPFLFCCAMLIERKRNLFEDQIIFQYTKYFTSLLKIFTWYWEVLHFFF